MIPGPGAVGIEHDGGADVPFGHQPGRLAEGVARAHREHDVAHPVPHLHALRLPERLQRSGSNLAPAARSGAVEGERRAPA